MTDKEVELPVELGGLSFYVAQGLSLIPDFLIANIEK